MCKQKEEGGGTFGEGIDDGIEEVADVGAGLLVLEAAQVGQVVHLLLQVLLLVQGVVHQYPLEHHLHAVQSAHHTVVEIYCSEVYPPVAVPEFPELPILGGLAALTPSPTRF